MVVWRVNSKQSLLTTRGESSSQNEILLVKEYKGSYILMLSPYFNPF